MWGLFVGIALGIMQMALLRVLGNKILGDSAPWVKALSVLLIMAKFALIVFVLYLLFTVSFAHLIWAASGMLIGLVLCSVFLIFWNKRSAGPGSSQTQEKDREE